LKKLKCNLRRAIEVEIRDALRIDLKYANKKTGKGVKKYCINAIKDWIEAGLQEGRFYDMAKIVLEKQVERICNLFNNSLSLIYTNLVNILEGSSNMPILLKTEIEKILIPIPTKYNINNEDDQERDESGLDKSTLTESTLINLDNLHELDPSLTKLTKIYLNKCFFIRYTHEGFVYVLSNPAYRSHLYKIGYTQQDPKDRAKELAYPSSIAMPFDVKKSWKTQNVRIFERVMHRLFTKARINKKREFFEAPIELIINVGNEVARLVANAIRLS